LRASCPFPTPSGLQASIWCFFSIAQILVMLFLIRETLLRVWGRAETHSLTTKTADVPVSGSKGKVKADKRA